jgi:hypothetical protein
MATLQDLLDAGAYVVGGQIDRRNVNLGRCTKDGGVELNSEGKAFVAAFMYAGEPEASAAPRAKKAKAAKPTEPVAPVDEAGLGDFLDSLPDA